MTEVTRRGTPPRVYYFVNSFLMYCFGVIPVFPHLNPERRRTMVKINGKEAADVCGMTVSQYLSANNYNPKHIVVELNEGCRHWLRK